MIRSPDSESSALRMRSPSGEVAEVRVRTSFVGDGKTHTSEVHRRRADETGHEQVVRVCRRGSLRRADLLDRAAAHHHDPVAERHRLGLVVGDVDRGGARACFCSREISVRIWHAQLGVQVGQRLVHQERLRPERTIARPIATRWRWPPDRLAGLRSSSARQLEDLRPPRRPCVRPRRSASLARRQREARCSRRTVMCG